MFLRQGAYKWAGTPWSSCNKPCGSGYQNPPIITITDSGSGANAVVTANLGYALNEIQVGVAGTYTSAPPVTITNAVGDTTGSGAAANATIGFPVASVTLDNQGLGYRNLPNLVPSTGDATADAQFSVVLNEQEGRVESITLAGAGVGYTSAPTLTFEGGGGVNAILTELTKLVLEIVQQQPTQ